MKTKPNFKKLHKTLDKEEFKQKLFNTMVDAVVDNFYGDPPFVEWNGRYLCLKAIIPKKYMTCILPGLGFLSRKYTDLDFLSGNIRFINRFTSKMSHQFNCGRDPVRGKTVLESVIRFAKKEKLIVPEVVLNTLLLE